MHYFIQKIKFRKRSDIIIKLLDPKNDYVFKRIFGQTGNEDITKSFLSSIVVCNVEMQICDKKNIEKRLLFYWSKMYSQGIKQSQDYDELKRTIVILISDYNLEKLKEIPEYVTKWNIRGEKYGKIISTDVLELYIIKLNKLKNGTLKDNQKLNSWLYFIKNSKVVVNEDMKEEDVEEIKKAEKILEDISADEHERWLAEMRLKYIRDKHAIEDLGYDKGYKAGVEQERKKSQKEIVKKLKEENMDVKFIKRVTGLTEEEIDKINNGIIINKFKI